MTTRPHIRRKIPLLHFLFVVSLAAVAQSALANAAPNWGVHHYFPERAEQIHVEQAVERFTLRNVEPGAEVAVFYIGREVTSYGSGRTFWEGWVEDDDHDGSIAVDAGSRPGLPDEFPGRINLVILDPARSQIVGLGQGFWTWIPEVVVHPIEQLSPETISVVEGDTTVTLGYPLPVTPILWREGVGLWYAEGIADGWKLDIEGPTAGDSSMTFRLADLKPLSPGGPEPPVSLAGLDHLVLLHHRSWSQIDVVRVDGSVSQVPVATVWARALLVAGLSVLGLHFIRMTLA